MKSTGPVTSGPPAQLRIDPNGADPNVFKSKGKERSETQGGAQTGNQQALNFLPQGEIKMAASKKNQGLKNRESYDHPIKLKEPLTVKCVCPKCGSNHRMKLLWTGRGRPKKFCPPCKIFVSSIEPVDHCPLPTHVDGRID